MNLRSEFLSTSLSLLNRLPIDIEVLTKTKIGKSINKLTKDVDYIVMNKSTSILKRWKQKAEQSIAKNTSVDNKVIICNKIVNIKQEPIINKPKITKIIKWASNNKLVTERMFLSDDPPNAPPVTDDDLEELSKK